MRDHITRRDFMNGVAIAVVASLSSTSGRAGETTAALDPPQRSGLRGSHAGSFEVAHALRDGKHFDLSSVRSEESFDLVVVGGGLSGLTAAHEYRRRQPKSRILILETNDDFGGHAKRNEFQVDGRTLIGYGGTQSIDSPRRRYAGVPARLLTELGVDTAKFQRDYDRHFYDRRDMKRAIFFKRETFGVDKLVRQPFGRAEEFYVHTAPHAALRAYLAEFPVNERAKSQLFDIYTSSRDILAGHSQQERQRILEKTSCREFLRTYWHADDDVLKVFQTETNGLWALGIDAVSAGKSLDLPGFQSLRSANFHAEDEEPYIYHFPDGNASLARLLVRQLVPGFATGHTMEDIVTAKLDYGALDRAGNGCRLRLESTVIAARNTADGVDVGYVRAGALHRIAARHCVLACYHAMMPYLVSEIAEPQRLAMQQNVRAPLVYVTLAARNWRAWEQLRVSSISNPGGTFEASLDFPVSIGGYRFSADPSQPICVHLDFEPGQPNQGLSAREQYRAGRQRLYGMSFGDFEREIRDELTRMIGAGGFDFDRDIAAITVNRWPHGYAYTPDTLWDDDADIQRTMATAKRRVGQIAIAGSDSGWDAYTDVAIREAHRAVVELLA